MKVCLLKNFISCDYFEQGKIRFAGENVGGSLLVAHKECELLRWGLEGLLEIQSEVGARERSENFHVLERMFLPVGRDVLEVYYDAFERAEKPQGFVIFDVGQEAKYTYILLSGTVDQLTPILQKPDPDESKRFPDEGLPKNSKVLRRVKGDFFGYIDFHNSAPRGSRAIVTSSQATFLYFNKKVYTKMLEKDSKFRLVFKNALSNKKKPHPDQVNVIMSYMKSAKQQESLKLYKNAGKKTKKMLESGGPQISLSKIHTAVQSKIQFFKKNKEFGFSLKKTGEALCQQNLKEAEVASQIEREDYFNLAFLNSRKNAVAGPEP